MKDWNYAKNSYYKTACYILEEAPWYIFFLEGFVMRTCDAFHLLPIPFGSKIKFIDKKEPFETYTLEEYYGSLGGIFHMFVCMPFVSWCLNKGRTDSKIIRTEYK